MLNDISGISAVLVRYLIPGKGSWRVAAGKVIQEAHNRLMADDTTLAWLQNERGIAADTARRFVLGWNIKDHWPDRAEFGLEDTGKKMLVPSGLVIPWQKSRIRIRRDNPGKMGRYPGRWPAYQVAWSSGDDKQSALKQDYFRQLGRYDHRHVVRS